MRILVIDGQGGNIGRQLSKMIMDNFPDQELIAIGTNSMATSNMLKSGVSKAATGENAVIVNSRNADVIIGPLGIVLADALLGEVTPKMAQAIGSSRAKKILIPMSKCDTLIAGVRLQSMADLLEDAIAKLSEIINK